MATLFELKEKMAGMQEAIRADAEWLTEKAGDPTVKLEDLEAKETHKKELQKRFNMLKAEHDVMEAAQKEAVKRRNETGESSEIEKKVKAKAAFYRAALTGGDIRKAYEGLGAIPTATADLGKGENLLPTNVSSELITEPVEENALRRVEPVSQISGLEEPKLLFSIEDSDLADVTDQGTANEIAMEGDTVSYGRFKTKIFCTVKDTVLHGTDTNLVATVESALRSGIAIKEKMRAFAPATGTGAYDATHKHMSFYAAGTGGVTEIKTVEGADLIEAILNAWADLPESFAANATCVMRKQDYYAAIRTLANGATDLWGKKPEDVLGIPVIFCDRAVTPVVGDFRYSKQNYDIGTVFETDKDGKKGEYYFILTAWGDHQIKLKSAFRLAKVKAASGE